MTAWTVMPWQAKSALCDCVRLNAAAFEMEEAGSVPGLRPGLRPVPGLRPRVRYSGLGIEVLSYCSCRGAALDGLLND